MSTNSKVEERQMKEGNPVVEEVETKLASLSVHNSSTTEKPSHGDNEEVKSITDSIKTTHPLQNKWVIWYDAPKTHQSNDSWEDSLKKVYTFDTVEDFWCGYNNILAPSKLPTQSNYHIFKEGVRPMWEDPVNTKGGKWVLTIPKAKRVKLDEYWMNTVLSMIGETLCDDDDLSGAVVSVRRSQDRIAIWTKTASDQNLQKAIGTSFRNSLDLPRNMSLKYQSHADASASGSSFQNQALYEV